MDLVVSIYQLTSQFQSREKFGLISQMNNPKEFNQFLGIAKGSIAELETQLEISNRLGLCGEMNLKNLFDQIDHIGRMITKLQSSIK